MNEKFIILMEKYFDRTISDEEAVEFDSILQRDPELKKEFEEQKEVKEVLSKMSMKNPEGEFWDRYWTGLYNRVERSIAWITITIGLIIVLGYAAVKAVEKFLEDSSDPLIFKIGVGILVAGFVILIISMIRERIVTYKHDKYKEIQR